MPEINVNELELDISSITQKIELVSGKQKKNPEKNWYGIKLVVAEKTFMIFPYPKQLKAINEALENKSK